MKRIMLMTAMLATSQVFASSVYRCEVNGEIIFSQQPCATNAEEVQLRYIRQDEEAALRTQEQHEHLSRQSREHRINTQLREEERAITRLQQQRDQELAQLRARQRNANNNLAGATYLQSINTEMQAVNQRYDSQIAQRQANIERLRADMASVRD